MCEDFIKDCGFKTYLGNPIHACTSPPVLDVVFAAGIADFEPLSRAIFRKEPSHGRSHPKEGHGIRYGDFAVARTTVLTWDGCLPALSEIAMPAHVGEPITAIIFISSSIAAVSCTPAPTPNASC